MNRIFPISGRHPIKTSIRPLCRQAIAVLLIGLLMTATASACPTCKQGIVEGADHDQLMRGYFWSILFMMSMPFVIFGGLTAYFYSAVRRARKAAVAAGDGSPEVRLGPLRDPPEATKPLPLVAEAAGTR